MGAAPYQVEDGDEDKGKRKVNNNHDQIEQFFICVDSGAATHVQEMLLQRPSLIDSSPPHTLPTMANIANQVDHLHAIHIAVNKCYYGVVKVLLEADPRCVDAYFDPTLVNTPYGEYPLQTLLMRGSSDSQADDMFNLLLEAKADVNCPQSKVKSVPLLLALKMANLKWAKRLLECQADVTVKSKSDVDPNSIGVFQASITYSSYSEDIVDFISLLIEKGVDTNVTTNNTESPLMTVVRNQNAKLASLLIKNKADVNIRNASNQTLLSLCLSSGANSQLFSELLAGGVDVFEIDNMGNSLLHILANSYNVSVNPNILKLVIQCGLNYDRKNSNNLTAMEVALNNHYREIVKMFIENHIGVEFWNPPNNHPLLHRLIQHRWENEIDLLFQIGADFNIHSPIGNRHTILHAAVNISGLNILKLISYGADPNARDQNGDTPLHYAVNNNAQSTVVESLLVAGADPTIKNMRGKTPKDLCSASWQSSIKQVLDSC